MILASEVGRTELVLGTGRVLAVEAKARTRQPKAVAKPAPGEGATVSGDATGTRQ